MISVRKILDRLTRSSLLAGTVLAALLFGASPASAQSAPPLGRVQSFAVLGGSAVTAAGPAGTVIGGDVGSAPTPSVSGFPPAVVTAGFTIYTAANAVTAGARLDAGTAFTNLAGQTCPAANIIAGGNLGGLNLGPGVYCMPTGNLTGTLTLTGSATDVWVFQMTLDTLTTASASQVVMAGGANACNVFWQVSSSATLGSGSTLRGNIFSGASISLGTTSHVIGRTIAGTGAVTLDGGNHVDTCATAGPGLAAPTLTTTVASSGVTLGAAISDTATLSGGGIGSAAPTGTIIFTLFGPNDATCATAAIFTSAVTVNGNGTYTSGSFTPSVIGTYRWIATYSGDANNAPTATACGDANETVIVSAALNTPTLSTVASPGVAFGGAIFDTATLSGGAAPTGTITFSLYGPNDPICDTTAIFTSTAIVSGNGTYTSASSTPLAIGTYRWRAGYSGDANNAAVLTACADVSESVIVSSPAAAGIPTLSGWGLMTLMVLVVLASIYRLRRL
jgi:hypothetical protein